MTEQDQSLESLTAALVLRLESVANCYEAFGAAWACLYRLEARVAAGEQVAPAKMTQATALAMRLQDEVTIQRNEAARVYRAVGKALLAENEAQE